MSSIRSVEYEEVEYFSELLAEGFRTAATFETASQHLVVALRERFPSIVLARVFATVPVELLPPSEQRFAAAAVTDVTLFPKAEVLTLFGTSGARPEWNDRRKSTGHLAMPLLNRRSIDEAPMLSRLLGDLQYTLDGEDPARSKYVTRAFANANGICFIPDARSSVDERGRLLVPAEDFVCEHEIRSVFAFGGSFVLQRMFVATILFTTETLAKENAMNFVQLSSAFKAATTGLVRRGALFESGEASFSSGGY